MTRRKLALILSALEVLAVAALIFCFSAQNGEESSALSGRVTEWLLTALKPRYAQLSAAERLAFRARWDPAVRKLAHFSEYALLGLSLGIFWQLWPGRRALRPAVLLPWGAGTAYAVTDELHQVLVEARGPSLLDMGIDSAGALAGALLAALLFALHRRRTAGKSGA